MRKALWFFSQNTVDCYNISLNDFLFYFIGKSAIVFLTKYYQLLQRFSHGFFFFQNYLCWFFFFNIKLMENLAL
jgi:hypothetical protein